MKFLVLTQYFPPEVGASQVRLAALCSELSRAGHRVEVVTAMPHHPAGRIFPEYRGRFYRREARDGLLIHRVWVYAGNGASFKRILSYLSFAFTCLYALLNAGRPDYVFVDSPPPFAAVAGWFAAKMWKARFIFNVADLWPDSVRDLGLMRDGFLLRLGYGLESWIYKHAGYVTAVTEGIRRALLQEKRVPCEKVLFLPNGVDARLFSPGAADESLKYALKLSGKRIVLYAGNHGYAGAVDQLIRAAAELAGERGIHFLFIGDGPEKGKLKLLARSLNLQNVTFLDPVPIENLPAYVSIADLAAITLRKSEITKGCRPAKTFVMMAAGKPIVMAGEGEAEQLIHAARAGIVVPPENPRQLARAIGKLLDNRAAAEQLGRNGRAFVAAHFCWSSLVRNWLDQLNAPAPETLPAGQIPLEEETANAPS